MSGLVLREGNSGILQEQEAVLPCPATALFTLSQLVRRTASHRSQSED